MRFVHGALFVLIGFLALGAGAYVARDLFGGDAPPTPVNMAVSIHQITGLMAVADGAGYFAREGIAPEFLLSKSGLIALTDLLEGRADIATVAETPIAIYAYEHPDLRVLATIGSTDKEEKVVARRDHGISRPEDLRGKTVATHKRGTSPHFFLHLFLTSHGLSDDDVKISFNEPKDVVGRLLRGEVDAIALSEPFVTEARTALGDSAVVFPNDGLYNRAYNLVTTAAYAQEHPRELEAILRALIDAESLVATDPQAAARHVERRFEIPERDVRRVFPELSLKVSLDQALLVSLDDQARWARERGYVESSAIPDFLTILHADSLERVKPSAVTVIR